MIINRANSLKSLDGPDTWFTGKVRIDPLLLQTNVESGATCATVTFEPGARTAWHTHPKGQIIVITSGHGYVQKQGGAIEEVNPGDVVFFEPDEKHWHGASPEIAMSHIAIQVVVEKCSVTWMEQVSDEEYTK